MLRVALDTNAYSDLNRGNRSIAEAIEQADEIILPFVVLAELGAGFSQGTRGKQNEQVLLDFLSQPNVAVLYADEQTTHQYAALHRELWGRGVPIPINDLWLAALAVQHELTICSRDTHFDHLSQIPRI